MKGFVVLWAVLACVGSVAGEKCGLTRMSIPFLYESKVSPDEWSLEDENLAWVTSIAGPQISQSFVSCSISS